MATCVVTGGAGFLGSHLCEALLARGNKVICVDNLETGSLRNIEHIRDELMHDRQPARQQAPERELERLTELAEREVKRARGLEHDRGFGWSR